MENHVGMACAWQILKGHEFILYKLQRFFIETVKSGRSWTPLNKQGKVVSQAKMKTDKENQV